MSGVDTDVIDAEFLRIAHTASGRIAVSIKDRTDPDFCFTTGEAETAKAMRIQAWWRNCRTVQAVMKIWDLNGIDYESRIVQHAAPLI